MNQANNLRNSFLYFLTWYILIRLFNNTVVLFVASTKWQTRPNCLETDWGSGRIFLANFLLLNQSNHLKHKLRICLFVWFDSLLPSQQFFSYVGTGLPGLNQYKASINVSCSRTQRSEDGEAKTHDTSVSSQALYQWATSLSDKLRNDEFGNEDSCNSSTNMNGRFYI